MGAGSIITNVGKALPVVGTAVGIGESIINPILQGVQNKKNRQFAEKMYGRQRQDALADWQRQNEYNSPAAQMERYKAAGLNPNLIYGQSNEGATVRSSSASVPEGKAPQVDASSKMGMYQDIRQRQAQTDLSVKALEMQDLNAELIRANIMKIISETNTNEYNLGYKKSMQENYSEMASKKVESLQVANALGWQKLEQSSKMFAVDMANKLLQGLKIQQDIKTAPMIRQQIAQNISASLTNQELIQLKKLSEQQQQTLFSEIQQSKIWQNKLLGQRSTLNEQWQEINRIKIQFKGMGVSEQVTENLIKAIIGIRIPQMGTPQATPPTSPYQQFSNGFR